MAGISDEADDGGDVDDARVGAFHERALKGFDEVEGSFKIGVEDGVPVFGLHAHEEAVAGDACVVDEDVDATKVCDDGFTEFLDGVEVGDVNGVESGAVWVFGVDFLRRGSAAGGVTRDDGELCPFGGESFGDG